MSNSLTGTSAVPDRLCLGPHREDRSELMTIKVDPVLGPDQDRLTGPGPFNRTVAIFMYSRLTKFR